MGKIVDLDEHRPHIVVHTDRGAEVIPELYFENIIKGEQELVLNDDTKALFKTIIKEWYGKVK